MLSLLLLTGILLFLLLGQNKKFLFQCVAQEILIF
jgi:hypothetical protein